MSSKIKIKWVALGVLTVFGTGYVVQNNSLEAAEAVASAPPTHQYVKAVEVAVYNRKRLPLSERRRAFPDNVHAANYPYF